MPPQVGFALTAAMRFLPDMISRTTLVMRAVELRGYDLSRPRWFQVDRWSDYVRRISRCVVLVTVPLLVGSLRGTTTMAMVADARGFGASKRRGSLRVHRRTAVDVCGYVVLVVLVVAAIVLNHFHIGARTYGYGAASRDRPEPRCYPTDRVTQETRCVTTQSCSTTAAR